MAFPPLLPKACPSWKVKKRLQLCWKVSMTICYRVDNKFVPDDEGPIIDVCSLADWAGKGWNILPPDERQLHSKYCQLSNLENQVIIHNDIQLGTLSRMEVLHTKMKKMRQPLRRLIHPMILKTNSVEVTHLMFLWSPWTMWWIHSNIQKMPITMNSLVYSIWNFQVILYLSLYLNAYQLFLGIFVDFASFRSSI